MKHFIFFFKNCLFCSFVVDLVLRKFRFFMCVPVHRPCHTHMPHRAVPTNVSANDQLRFVMKCVPFISTHSSMKNVQFCFRFFLFFFFRKFTANTTTILYLFGSRLAARRKMWNARTCVCCMSKSNSFVHEINDQMRLKCFLLIFTGVFQLSRLVIRYTFRLDKRWRRCWRTLWLTFFLLFLCAIVWRPVNVWKTSTRMLCVLPPLSLPLYIRSQFESKLESIFFRDLLRRKLRACSTFTISFKR